MIHKDLDCLSEAETERRREAALKRMLNTPHKPHIESGKPRKGQKKLSPKKAIEA